jgi:pyruvate/2-oxoglutarate dehydrogenase complex dihydrolipoamide dehydrogenase (E3) component
MERELTPDLCVIGAGAGGIAAATTAASYGATVVLIERDRMGGTRLNHGCISSKALLACARECHAVRRAGLFGIRVPEPEVDYKAIMARVQAAVDAVAPNDAVARLTGLGIDVLREDARFTDPTTVLAGSARIKAKAFVIATGSKVTVPATPGLNRIPFLTEETLRHNLQRFPHLVIVGGRATGLELAQAVRRLGSDVTVLDPGVPFPSDDPELRGLAVAALAKEGVRIVERARVDRVENFGNRIQIVFSIQSKAYSLDASHLLLATARTPATTGLNLDSAGVALSDRGIAVNTNLQTANPRVYAAGDVTGDLMYSHVAAANGAAAARHALFGTPPDVPMGAMPWTTFTDPEIAHVGLTEEAARERHGQLNVVRWPYFESDRAHTDGTTEGLMKVIATKRGQILGAGIVGAGAGDIIHVWSLAMQKGLTIEDMSELVCASPTLGEMNRRAALAHLGPVRSRPALRVKGLLAKVR